MAMSCDQRPGRPSCAAVGNCGRDDCSGLPNRSRPTEAPGARNSAKQQECSSCARDLGAIDPAERALDWGIRRASERRRRTGTSTLDFVSLVREDFTRAQLDPDSPRTQSVRTMLRAAAQVLTRSESPEDYRWAIAHEGADRNLSISSRLPHPEAHRHPELLPPVGEEANPVLVDGEGTHFRFPSLEMLSCCPQLHYPANDPAWSVEFDFGSSDTSVGPSGPMKVWHAIFSFNFNFSATFSKDLPCYCPCCEFAQYVVQDLIAVIPLNPFLSPTFESSGFREDCVWEWTCPARKFPQTTSTKSPDSPPGCVPNPKFTNPTCYGRKPPDGRDPADPPDSKGDKGYSNGECLYKGNDNAMLPVPIPAQFYRLVTFLGVVLDVCNGGARAWRFLTAEIAGVVYGRGEGQVKYFLKRS